MFLRDFGALQGVYRLRRRRIGDKNVMSPPRSPCPISKSASNRTALPATQRSCGCAEATLDKTAYIYHLGDHDSSGVCSGEKSSSLYDSLHRKPKYICHGADLKGAGIVPTIAGRSPSYIVRQLVDIQSGFRVGTGVAPMVEVVKQLRVEEIIAIAAYLATLR